MAWWAPGDLSEAGGRGLGRNVVDCRERLRLRPVTDPRWGEYITSPKYASHSNCARSMEMVRGSSAMTAPMYSSTDAHAEAEGSLQVAERVQGGWLRVRVPY
jgi:hypothetical protein